MKDRFVIAVDGPAAAGKGTLSRRLAHFYNLSYLDTGSLYRGVGWLVLARDIDPQDEAATAGIAAGFSIDAIVDADIRTPEVGRAASIIATQQPVREALFGFQRAFSLNSKDGRRGAILDGRDIGTVVMPEAQVKLFVTARAEIRAKRRWRELQSRNAAVPYAQVLAEIERRDHRDATRALAPLKPAADACLLDTSDLGIDAAFAAACREIDRIVTVDEI